MRVDYDEEEQAEIRLASAPNMTAALYDRTVGCFGSALEALRAEVSDVAGALGAPGARVAAHLNDGAAYKALLAALEKCGAYCLTRSSDRYPPGLRGVDDEPVMLYAVGDVLPDYDRTVAIVGARRNTLYGQRCAARLAEELTAGGAVVVSGLAEGIDSIAQGACLDAGGVSVGFVAGGVNRVVPYRCGWIYDKMNAGGLLLSEYPPDLPTKKWMFVRRNRLISGVSRAVVLIEARQKSGTVGTIDYAALYGREVFAVPGRIDEETSYWPNKLISQGASPVTCGNDIFSEMRWGALGQDGGVRREKLDVSALAQEERRIVLALARGAMTVESLAQAAGLSVQTLLMHLTTLEMEGIIEQFPGRRLEIASKYRV